MTSAAIRITLRAILWVVITLLIDIGIVVGTALTLAFVDAAVGLPEWADTVARWVALFFCFIVVPPAIVYRGGWSSSRMESMGCWMLFLGPIGWFVLYWWREAADARTVGQRSRADPLEET